MRNVRGRRSRRSEVDIALDRYERLALRHRDDEADMALADALIAMVRNAAADSEEVDGVAAEAAEGEAR